MIARLLETAPIWGSTIAPAVVLLAIGWFLRPQGGRRWLGLHPAAARDVVRRLEAERAHQPRPTGFQSPLFTVPREAVTR